MRGGERREPGLERSASPPPPSPSFPGGRRCRHLVSRGGAGGGAARGTCGSAPWQGEGTEEDVVAGVLPGQGGAPSLSLRPWGLVFHRQLGSGGSVPASAGSCFPALHGLSRKASALPEEILASGVEGRRGGGEVMWWSSSLVVNSSAFHVQGPLGFGVIEAGGTLRSRSSRTQWPLCCLKEKLRVWWQMPEGQWPF